ncbi:unnamed protein product [Linum tenue]|uniref:Uncharacterized protein n=1 Tax=Linum tenue TaxID=586396 RepID=A0AAV0HTU8_9ROSI|nr:unnamed protein product [Linum tenue]
MAGVLVLGAGTKP